MTIQNFFLSVLLSLVITFTLATGYAFATFLYLFAKSSSSDRGTAGIAAVSGGTSISRWIFLLTSIIVFAILFLLLGKRRAAQ